MLRRFAALYALGVVLLCPAALHADDPVPAAGQAPAAGATAGPNAAAPAPQADATPPQPAPSAPSAPAPAPAAPAAAPAPAAPPAQSPEDEPKPVAEAAASGTVSMRDFSFSPATITVNVGDSVTWVNNGQAPHNAVGNGVNTSLLQKGQSDSQSFSNAGTFSYICTVHPQMKGTVKVVAASSGGGGSGGGSGSGSSAQSGSGSTGGTSGSGDTSSGASASGTTGSTLPSTGIDAWLLAAIGVVLLGVGIGLRDRARVA